MEFRTLIKHKAGSELDMGDEIIKLEPGADGFCTFTTDNPATIERLLQIPEGFAPVDAAPATPSAPGEFVLHGDDGQRVDLATLGDDELQSFAADAGVKLHHKQKGDNARRAIVNAIKGQK